MCLQGLAVTTRSLSWVRRWALLESSPRPYSAPCLHTPLAGAGSGVGLLQTPTASSRGPSCCTIAVDMVWRCWQRQGWLPATARHGMLQRLALPSSRVGACCERGEALAWGLQLQSRGQAGRGRCKERGWGAAWQ